MGISKVEYYGQTLVDLTQDTVAPETLAEGVTAHSAAGELITGTMKAAAEVILQSKTVTPTSRPQEVTADADYTALEKVTVEAIPSAYVIPSGTKEITTNGLHSVLMYSTVNVNVVAGSSSEMLDKALNGSLTAIDSDVTSIVAYACRGLSKIKTVNLPEATSIGTYAFYYCTAMTSINAPKVKSLGTYAFYNCDMLKSVNFPLVTTIAQNSLYSCAALEKADFGVAGTINQAALAYCENLTALILRKSDAICKLATATNALQGSAIANGTGYVYVPKALIETYKTATNWVNYASQLRAIEDYPEICG